MQEHILKTTCNLKKNKFNVEYFCNRDSFKEFFFNQVDSKASVGIGGSMTIQELGLYDELINNGNKVYWHWKADKVDRKNTLKSAAIADVYISSSNAITQDGKIINIDGAGNRISSMCFGHDNVYIIVGDNKIAENQSAALKRIKTKACPSNSERLGLDTPCRFTGRCSNCNSSDRMCGITCILEHQPMGGNITVCIIDEELGY